MLITNRKIQNKSVAQGMMEFALAIPVLLTVLVGMIEISRLMLMFVSVTTASRTSARYGSAVGIVDGAPQYKDCTGIKNAGLIMSPISGIATDNITIEYDSGAGSTSTFATCDSLSGNITFGDRILVSVTTYYTPLNVVPFFSLNSFPMKSTSRRLILISDPDAGGTATPGGPLWPANTAGPAPTLTSTYPPPPTHTPIATLTSTITPSVSLTPSQTPTESSTPTETDTPPATNTPQPIPHQPIFLNNFSTTPDGPQGHDCSNVTITWSDSADWDINPGHKPVKFRIYREVIAPWYGDHPFGAQNVGSIDHNKTLTVHVKAIFPGFLNSYTLSINVGCKFGELTSIVQWTNNPISLP